MTRWIAPWCHVLCMFATAGCSIVGDSEFWIVESDSGTRVDAAPPDTGPPDAGSAQTTSCLPPGVTCERNGDCCGFADDESLCVARSGQPGGSLCLAVCASGLECQSSEICTRIAEGDRSVCAPP